MTETGAKVIKENNFDSKPLRSFTSPFWFA